MRIVFAGTPAVAVPSLEALSASNHEIVAVLTRPDAPRGRSKRPVPSPAAAWALDRGIEVLRPAKPSAEDFVGRLRELAPDACPVVAYGALIPAPVLTIPPHGWVNVHFSLLPAWRGAAPVQRAIIAGDQVGGITVFGLVPALDAGPCYLAEPTPLGTRETSGDVLDRLAVRGAELLVNVLDGIADGTASAVPQAGDGVSLAPRLTVAEAAIDWDRPAIEIDRLIRGCNPSPVAWTTISGERLRILSARPTEGAELAPGLLQVHRRGVVVGTGAGNLELLSVHPAGRKAMAADAWGRGLPSEPGRLAS